MGSITETPSPFANLPLDATRSTLRLWRFGHRDTDIGMHIVLEAFTEDVAPRYIALSYMWGGTANSRCIAVNNSTLTITENLWHFLQTLRGTEHRSSWFWADQISLNQQDAQERNHQVRLMGDIYANAKTVFAWLGALPYGLEWPVGKIDFADEHGLRKRAQALIHMCASEYWERLWIVQELHHSARSILWYGHHALDADNFLVAILACSQFFPHVGASLPRAQEEDRLRNCAATFKEKAWPRIFSLLDATARKNASSLENVMRLHCQGQCSDPRDKMYSVQGLVVASQRIPIDYSVDCNTAALRTLKNILINAELVSLDHVCYGTPENPFTCDHGMHTTSRYAVEHPPDVYNMAPWLSGLVDTMKELQLTGETTTALVWSHVMGQFGRSWQASLAEGRSDCRASDLLEIWNQIESLATTTKQKILTRDLRQLHEQYVKMTSERFMSDRPAMALAIDLESRFEQLAAESGFLMFGQFLSCLEDWPFNNDEPVETI